VSSTGSDANGCTRGQPCLTFNGALAKTAAGGEINCIDSADYGLTTINKSITIDCLASVGLISTGGSTTALSIAANAGSDTVTIRNLSIRGAAGYNGYAILISGASAVHIDNVTISNAQVCVNGFGQNQNLNVTIQHSTLTQCSNGVVVTTSSPALTTINLDDVTIRNGGFALSLGASDRSVVRNSNLSSNQSAVAIGGPAVIRIERSTLSFNVNLFDLSNCFSCGAEVDERDNILFGNGGVYTSVSPLVTRQGKGTEVPLYR
jgi:hypothetical protein